MKAVLYARVSTDKQEKERTIESQLEELKRQIAKNGDTLVKEYVDDGYSGKYLDRPALNELREGLKSEAFDVVYFLAADRIARKSVHQDIIVNEILQQKKRVVINDKDYEKNPENELSLKIFGAVAEFERAKIIERMRRGWLHKLRNGQLSSHGQVIYGYNYIRKTPTSPPNYEINEKEAEIIRYIFETYANETLGVCQISRALEKKGIPTRRGRLQWKAEIIRRMLQNTSYIGTRYFNRMTQEQDDPVSGQQKKRIIIYRDPSEWIAVKVPPIVSKKIFEKAQARLKKTREKYRKPNTQFLLSRLVKCGECGRSYCSCRWFERRIRSNGDVQVNNWAAYRCSTRQSLSQHDLSKLKRCWNSQIVTHILEKKVLDLIQTVMLDAEQLSKCIEYYDRPTESTASQELIFNAEQIAKVGELRQKLVNGYATGRTNTRQYVQRNKALDKQLKRLNEKKLELARTAQQDGLSGKSIRQFCAEARLQFETSNSFDAKQKFLRERIEKVVFTYGKVAIVGMIPVYNGLEKTELLFKIQGEIDDKRSRGRAMRLARVR